MVRNLPRRSESIALLALLFMIAPAVARASPGEVQTTDGLRYRGDVQEVVPGSSARLRLGDGALRTFEWSEIRFVLDGDRIYDAAGNQGRIPMGLGGVPATQPQVVVVVEPDEPPARRRLRPGRFAPPPGAPLEAWLAARPRRGPTVILHVLGSVFLVGSTGLIASAADTCTPGAVGTTGSDPCAGRVSDGVVGALMAASGSLMIGYAARRSHLYRASDAQWLRLGREATSVRLHAPAMSAGRGAFRMQLRFTF